jgi:type IV secretory pathway VirJ component
VFTDVPGWTPALERAAMTLADEGIGVAGVDTMRYLVRLATGGGGECLYVAGDVEETSKRLQDAWHASRYASPIVAGIGAGATLAYATLAQAPAAPLAGAISVEPAAALASAAPLCGGAPATPRGDGTFAYGRPVAMLPGFWQVSAARPAPELRALVTAAGGTLTDATDDSVAALSAMIAAAAPRSDDSAPSGDRVAELPLVVLPVGDPQRLFAVIYSGDGGWRDLDATIGRILAARGVPVVGVDSLRYFWQPKSPERVARDLAEMITTYARQWGTQRAVLIGYSFGAGILPFAVNRVPDDVRRRVVQVSLLGLGARAPFAFRFGEWLGRTDADAPEVLPELLRMDLARLQCVYGRDERDTLCTNPALAGAEIIATAGGHHFDGNYTGLADRILAGAARRLQRDDGG